MNIPTVKELVSGDKKAEFVRYAAGNLWYRVCRPSKFGASDYFEFPVDLSDGSKATFLAEEKAILLMRWIRKHIQMLSEAQKP